MTERGARVVVIGAGVGGLTTAARLARLGVDVTILEAHIYPGGCAGTFYHKGYRFDAGATLAGGFYDGGPMDQVAQLVDVDTWPAHTSEPAMVVHLPDTEPITRWGDERRWETRSAAFGVDADDFWRWQERTADALWDLALRRPGWPPQSANELLHLGAQGLSWLAADPASRLHPSLMRDLFSPVARHLRNASEKLCLFIDGQLLIAAQATSARANALYGAAALDLPRRGIVHFEGGIGSLASTLVDTIKKHGGAVHHREEATRIMLKDGHPQAVETKRGHHFPADVVVANLPPWNIAPLLGNDLPRSLRALPARPRDGWGAFTLHVGLDGRGLPQDFPLHHQVIVREPLGEGNSLFLSLSPAGDTTRGPAGKRALTISTHTELTPWWSLHESDPQAYAARKEQYATRMLADAARALPGLSAAAELVLPGTPVTFQRFTRRVDGWVGGFPQTDLFRPLGPRLSPRLWMVGDSIFPGQSTAAVALGGLRVADSIMHGLAGTADHARLSPAATAFWGNS